MCGPPLYYYYYHYYPLQARVPSFSNIADGPSRSKPEEAMRLLSVSVCLSFNHPPELIACLLNS